MHYSNFSLLLLNLPLLQIYLIQDKLLHIQVCFYEQLPLIAFPYITYFIVVQSWFFYIFISYIIVIFYLIKAVSKRKFLQNLFKRYSCSFNYRLTTQNIWINFYFVKIFYFHILLSSILIQYYIRFFFVSLWIIYNYSTLLST